MKSKIGQNVNFVLRIIKNDNRVKFVSWHWNVLQLVPFDSFLKQDFVVFLIQRHGNQVSIDKFKRLNRIKNYFNNVVFVDI